MRLKNIGDVISVHRTLILRIIAVLIVVIFGLLVFKLISVVTKDERDPEVSSSFFIKNKDDKYAMFNDKGKQLTDFIYDSVEEIYNGVAKVKDKDGKFAILNEKGKYVVKPGKYSSIQQNGGLFKVEEKENVYNLLDSKGNKLLKKNNFDIKSNSYLYAATIVLNRNRYVVYTYKGKKVYTFKVNEDLKNEGGEETAVAPASSNFKEYVSVFYDGVTVIFNAKTGRIIKKIEGEEQYCINNASEDGHILALNSCTTWYEESENPQYKLLVNGKLKDKDGECDSVGINGDNLVCTKNGVGHLLDKKFNILDTDLSLMSYKDTKNYAVKSGNDVIILRNNKNVKKLENSVLSDKGYTELGIYLIYKDSEYTFYNENGEELFGKKFKKALTFDSNGLARVSEDGENYYFINAKGKKVGDYIDASYQTKEFYVITKSNKRGVFNAKGDILVDAIYENIEIKTVNDKFYAFMKKGDEYSLFSLDKKKETLKLDKAPLFFEHYVKLEKDDKTTYYTYDGKKLFEE